jgi:hypothetical protein
MTKESQSQPFRDNMPGRVTEFSCRAIYPAYEGQKILANGAAREGTDEVDLWITNKEGIVCVTALARNANA